MYGDLARTVILGPDDPRIDAEIRSIIEKHPKARPEEIAERLIARAAARSSAVGAIASIPAGFLPLLPAAADMSYQVLALHRLALGIARARRYETTPLERAAAGIGSLALAGAAGVFRKGFLRGARRAMSRRAPRLVPFAGAFAGAVSGALGVWAAGRLANAAFGGGRR